MDARLSSPAALRNREVILAALRTYLPEQGRVLEVASGTGEHVVHFAEACPGIVFQPSDLGAAQRASIDSWAAGLVNVLPAIALDTTADWPPGPFDAVLCSNMVHIAPFQATIGLLQGAARLLPAGGLLMLYGPYRRHGDHTAPSNRAFDADLRARNPEWGIRDMEVVVELAVKAGFAVADIMPVPANNFILAFQRNAEKF